MDSVEFAELSALIKDLHTQLNELRTSLKEYAKPPFSHRSEDIAELAAALSKAQGEFAVAQLNRKNPYFKSKYADLMSVVSSARPALTKYGLSVVQDIIADETGSNVLHTILLHSTGQYIESRMKIVPAKSDIQTISSHVTYLKRLTYASLVGVVTGDEDDDGEASVAQQREVYAKGVAKDEEEVEYVVISKDQHNEILRELGDDDDLTDRFLRNFKIANSADLPKAHYEKAISGIRLIKERQGSKK